MAVSPEEIIASAEKLLEAGDEVSFRLSAIQSFYACYHSCKTVADDFCLSGQPGGSGGDHQMLIGRFTSASGVNTRLRPIGHMLAQMRSTRVTASYQLDVNFTLHEAKEQLSSSKKLLDRLAELSNAIRAQGLAGNR